MSSSSPLLAALVLLATAAPGYAADGDAAAAQNLQDQAAGRVSTRLKSAGGAFELRESAGDMPNGPAQAQTAAAPAPAAPSSAARPAADRTMDRISVPAPVPATAAAPAAVKTASPPVEIASAAQAAWTEARSQLSAPRPPGGIPTEQLAPAARIAAQAILGRLPSRESPQQASALSMSAVPAGSAVLMKPNIAFDAVRLGMDVAVARDMDPGRGVLQGNPSLTAGLVLGRAGHPGATTLDVGWRPAGRELAESTRFSAETVLLARKDQVLKLNGSVTSSPVADATYKVGLAVAARIF